jgi:hypothetical protein
MKRQAPLLTLAAAAVLGGGLLAADIAATPTAGTATAAASTGAAAGTEAPGASAAPAAAPAAAAPVVAQAVFAGRSAGREVTIAIAVKDGKAVAYVCDGKKIEAWLEGTLTGDRLDLKGPGGAAVDGTATATAATGTVTAGGKSWPYTVKVVKAPEGLYEGRADVRGVATRIGWIVVDGKQTGLRRDGERVLDAPALDPSDPRGVVVDGTPVTVRTGLELVTS